MKLNGYIGTIDVRQDRLYWGGKTDYRILIPENATEAERFAAAELTDIFAKAGVTIETVTDADLSADPEAKFIALGNTVYFKALNRILTQREFKFDGFIIETLGNTHIIKGVGDTGTCFGTYGFAEYAMGYRYYAEDEVRVAAQGENRDFHIKDIPTFFGRNAFSHDTRYHFDHGFRLRVNGEFSERTAKHGEGIPWSSLTDISNATQILDWQVYQKEHPDWYYIDPKNVGRQDARGKPQICYSKGLLSEKEGGFKELFVKNLIENYIIPEKDKIFFMLGMSDTWDFCPCELCNRAVDRYTRSGLSMRFVNMVADEVEKWREENAPERVIYLITFAYHTTFEAPVVRQGDNYVPVDPSVVARENVIVQYAPIDANYLYPLMDPAHNAASRKSILGWSAVAKHLCVWDYRQDFHDAIFPFPAYRTAQANIDLYAELGVVEVFNQAQRFCSGSPFIDMDNFARARMHWNHKEKYDELCDEFRKVYYQEAEPAVTAYYHALPAFWKALEEQGYVGYVHHAVSRRKRYNTLERLDHFAQLLEQGLAAVDTIADPERRARICRRVEVLTLYHKIARLYCFPFSAPKEQMLELLADVRRIAEENGVCCYHHRKPMQELLDECEGVIRGTIPERQRKSLPAGELSVY